MLLATVVKSFNKQHSRLVKYCCSFVIKLCEGNNNFVRILMSIECLLAFIIIIMKQILRALNWSDFINLYQPNKAIKK